jgi:hypothetical protein
MERRIASRAGAIVLTCVHVALADPQPERAQQLFDQARALMKDGEYAAACPLFAESQRLDPGGGTLLNLGICYEKEGRPASAYRELKRALERAESDGRTDRMKTAQTHIESVLPRLSWVKVRLRSAEPPAGWLVEIDGATVAANNSDALPLDPGEHELVVRAEHRKPWATPIIVTGEAQKLEVDVPDLEPLEEAPRAAPAPALAAPIVLPPPVVVPSPGPAAPAPAEPVRWPGYVALGAGAAALSASVFLVWRSSSLKADSNEHFDGSHCLTQSCVEDWNDARSAAFAADITAIAGVAAVGFGTFWLLRAGKEKPPSHGAGWSLQVGQAGALISARSRF